MAARIMRPPVVVSDEDLRKAWRRCRLVNMTFEAAMAIPALSLTLRRVAECELRRQLRIAEQQSRDRKRAQANDLFDQP